MPSFQTLSLNRYKLGKLLIRLEITQSRTWNNLLIQNLNMTMGSIHYFTIH